MVAQGASGVKAACGASCADARARSSARCSAPSPSSAADGDAEGTCADPATLTSGLGGAPPCFFARRPSAEHRTAGNGSPKACLSPGAGRPPPPLRRGGHAASWRTRAECDAARNGRCSRRAASAPVHQPRREATGRSRVVKISPCPCGRVGDDPLRLRPGPLLGHDELAAGEVDAGCVEADDDLERKHHRAEHIAVQRVPVAGPVTQQDLSGIRLPGPRGTSPATPPGPRARSSLPGACRPSPGRRAAAADRTTRATHLSSRAVHG